MELSEIKTSLRVRVPASEKNHPGGGISYHYAYVRDILPSLLSEDETVVIVSVPALGIEKAVSPALLVPARKTQNTNQKGEKDAGPGGSPGG